MSNEIHPGPARAGRAPAALGPLKATLLAVLLFAGAAVGLTRALADEAFPPLPATPGGGFELVEAHAFSLAQPYVTEWRADHPTVASGWLLVLRTEPTRLVPRQSAEPVLYVGEQVAERVNPGGPSGHVVVVVPAPLVGDGADLSVAPIFLGTPELPERVDAAVARAELATARARGIGPVPRARIAAVTGKAWSLATREELLDRAVDLVEVYSPEETDFLRGMRAPRIGR